MSTKARILEDVTRLAGGSVGLLGGLRDHAKEGLHYRIADIADKLDLVPREDFERLEAMLTKSRTEQEELSKRLDALENKKSKAKK